MKTELRETVAHGETISREEILARLEDRGARDPQRHVERNVRGPPYSWIDQSSDRGCADEGSATDANFNQEIPVYCAGAT